MDVGNQMGLEGKNLDLMKVLKDLVECYLYSVDNSLELSVMNQILEGNPAGHHFQKYRKDIPGN